MGPITVVTSGSNVHSATGSDVLFSSKNPFTKLDTQNIVSFQTISILFNREPPQPPSVSPQYTDTLIYQFPHGYTYIPAIWMMWQNTDPEFPSGPTSGNSVTTYYPFGDDTTGPGALYSLQNNTASSLQTSQVAIAEYNNGTTTSPVTSALFHATADTNNVYLYLMKTVNALVGGSIVPLYMAGVTLNVRIYVFTEPASTSIY